MKAMSINSTKGIQTGSIIRCIDNTGAKKLEVIAVKGYKGIRKRHPSAGIGGVVTCAVKTGNQKIKHEVVKAVIVTQTKEFKRANGVRIKFQENTAVLIQDNNEPRGKQIKGIIAKEVVERFPMIGKIAATIV
ncbi:MAG: uL14 family ribosomal protein [DPANN group archaeon]|nr:uL14 family ribosomal protein [DPANN group archaeon]